jgi:acetyltransferase (GNAT) family protein
MRDMVEEFFGRWDRADQRRRLADRSEEAVEVIEADGEPVGAIHLATANDGGIAIGLVEVLTQHQRRGVGGQAIARLPTGDAAWSSLVFGLSVMGGTTPLWSYRPSGHPC